MAALLILYCLGVLPWLPLVYSKPTHLPDDRYFSINNASLESLNLLKKRVDCSLNPVYCPAYNINCPAGTTCCYSRCCNPGYACYTDGYCYTDVVYTYCSTTTWFSTSYITSVFYSTIYSTSQFTSTSWLTATTTVQAQAVTTTTWITIANRLKRDRPTQTEYLLDPPMIVTAEPTSPPRYEMRDISPGFLFRRELENLGLLDKRTSYATITVFYTTTSYSYYFSTSHYTQVVTSGTTSVVSTYTTTVYNGAITTHTVTSTRRADSSVPADKSVTKGPRGLPIGVKVGIAVGCSAPTGLIILGVILCWRHKRKRERERRERARLAENERLVREHAEKIRMEQAEAVRKRQLERDETLREEKDEQLRRERDEKLRREQAEIVRQKSLIPVTELQEQPENPNITVKRRQPYDTLLLGTNEIRILVLHPDNFNKPIRCTLKRTYIGDSPDREETIRYEALSYVWEQNLDPSYKPETPLPDPDGKVHIFSDNGPSAAVTLKVGSNLEMALRHLRKPDNDRAVWTDQLCVDQEHKPEINVQMGLMRSVYKKATKVIAWLGENETGVDALIVIAERIQEFAPIVTRVQAETGEPLSSIDPAADKLVREIGRGIFKQIATDEDRETIARIVGLPFWSRRWILQEITLARSLQLQMGRKHLSWISLNSITEMIDPDRFHPTDDFHIAIDSSRVNDMDALLNNIRRRLRPMQILQSMWATREKKKLRRFCLLDLVQALRNWECGVPADRILAVIGLICDEDLAMNKPAVSETAVTRFFEAMSTGADVRGYPGLRNAYQPMYSNPKINPVEEFCRMVEGYGRLVESHATLYGTLDGLNSHTGQVFLHMPSWVPNFHVPSRWHSLIDGVPNDPQRWLIYERPIFKATGNSIARLRRFGDPSPMFLMVHGRLFDGVSQTLEPFECSTARSVDIITRNMQEWAARVSPKIDSWGPAVYDDDFEEAVRFTSIAGLTTRRDSGAPNRVTREELYQNEMPQGNGTLHRMSLQHAGPVFRAQCGRRPFLTKMGFIGIGPAHMCDTDVLCLLDGGQTPYVIRLHPSATWTFIGECYIHEIMDGETLS